MNPAVSLKESPSTVLSTSGHACTVHRKIVYRLSRLAHRTDWATTKQSLHYVVQTVWAPPSLQVTVYPMQLQWSDTRFLV